MVHTRMKKYIFLVFLGLSLVKCAPKVEPVTAENALERYLQNGDVSFDWELKENSTGTDADIYNLLLTSQQWREHLWKHQLTIIVPRDRAYEGALLFITGGSLKDGTPNWKENDEELITSLTGLALKNKATVAIVWQVPNQPLYDDLTEDALISFTLHNFKEDGDFTWPLLFPMTKTAIRAMDAIQAFSKENLKQDVNNFVVAGGSKRGWTTWLTGAHDDRVAAIAPMVIDVLNMPVSLEYQLEVWDDYSVQIEDYVKLEIPQQVHTEKGDQITKMIDPYSYRKKLALPKLIMIGTNDEYWPVDAIKNYIDSIPGKNYIHYVPNAGHDLGGGGQALRALSAFFGNTLTGNPYPEYQWNLDSDQEGIKLEVISDSRELKEALIWTALSEDRDFRDEEWNSSPLSTTDKPLIMAKESYPDSGYRAFYVDLIFEDPNGGEYSESTRMYVADDDEVFVK